MFTLDYSNPWLFLLLIVAMFAVVVIRYFIVAGGFYLWFYIRKPDVYFERKLNNSQYYNGQFRKEVKWSLITSGIFAITGAFTLLAWQNGHTAIYLDVNAYGWGWFFFSIIPVLLIHETYYYWLHRWMHRPKVFRKVHKVHHDSLITSPWTAFSFHPWEGLIEAIIVPLIIFFIPLHPYVILFYLTFMTVTSVVNHLDIEIYPKGFDQHWLGKWLIGATHHHLHHKQFRYNYGLYFTFWDRWMNTESPHFRPLFREKTL